MVAHVVHTDQMKQSLDAKKAFNWRWFLKAAALCTLIYVACMYVYFCPLVDQGICNKIIFHPEKKDGPWTVRSVAGHEYQDVFFKSKNGSKLHGWYFPVKDAKYTFLCMHGNGGNLAYRTPEMELLLGTGSSVLMFDYQGYGMSEGKPTLSGVVDDAQAAYNFLVREKHVDPQHLILFGESLGTSVAGNLSRRVECAGIVLQCPIASIRRRACEIVGPVCIYPDFLWPSAGFDNVGIFREKHAPLLLISGTLDPMIPVAHGDDLFRQASQPKTYVRIEGVGHTGDPRLTTAPEYARALNAFLQRL